ncbi:MAG: hypothetical protein ACTJGH_04600 [Peptoniphilaceae bacterium]
MNKRLEKKYSERKKIMNQIKKYENKLKDIDKTIEELEKTELYKDFMDMDISIKEYKHIMQNKIDRYQGKEEIENFLEENVNDEN